MVYCANEVVSKHYCSQQCAAITRSSCRVNLHDALYTRLQRRTWPGPIRLLLVRGRKCQPCGCNLGRSKRMLSEELRGSHIAHDVAESEWQNRGSSMVLESCTAQNFWDNIICELTLGKKTGMVQKVYHLCMAFKASHILLLETSIRSSIGRGEVGCFCAFGSGICHCSLRKTMGYAKDEKIGSLV